MSVMAVLPFLPMTFLYLVFLAHIFCCSTLGFESPSRTCHPIDLLALKEFAGNITSGSILSGWSNSSICCQWDGVVCDTDANRSVAGRVTVLNLSGKGLKGVLSQSLGDMERLKVLNVSHNLLTGRLPSDLSKLKLLEVLDLSHNMLVGSASEALVGLESIRSLDISSNSLNGDLFPIGELQNVVAFNASNNAFTGGFASEICISKAIQILDLSTNHFTGGLEGLTNCSISVRQLLLDWNSFSGELPGSLYAMSSLEHLSVSANNFSGQLSSELSKLSNLKILVLSKNHFSGPFPNVFGNLTQLEQFIAHSNSFSALLPSTLALCKNLRLLNLRNNSLSGLIDLDFTALSHLSALDLASNHFTGPLPDPLSNCQQLKILSLAKNKLTGQVPESYANLTSLLSLSLSNNSFVNLTGALSVLGNCSNITTLILMKNFNGEEIPQRLRGFDHLMILALGNCGLRGQIPYWLLNCRKLQVLDLSWNHLDGSLPSWMGQMESMFYLDLSNNSLTGEIPKSLTELKSLISDNRSISSFDILTGIPLFVKRNQSASGLQYNQVSSFPPSIYLSNNRINGTIWPEIGQWKQLHVLDLSRNNITGTIPSSISDMRNLEVLDLSYNDLDGSIPSSFNKLTFLSMFSVAYNHLQGAIPTGGQFLSFPSTSFEGNPGLCSGIVSPCHVDSNKGLQPKMPSRSDSKFGGGSILGLTCGIGVGIALLLAVLLLKLSRGNVGEQIDDLDEELGRVSRPSNAFGPSKLVLFQNSDCKDLTVADLLKSTNNFNQANIIGCGGFGMVYKADLPNGKKAAIKRLSGDCGQMEREFQAEVEALSRAQHKNLVSLQGYCRHGYDSLLIYSYMENGSLDYWLHENFDGGSFLSWDARLQIARGAALGLAYLHKVPNIIHRDVKTSNILLDERFEAHLADFGLSRLLHPYDTHVTTDLVGTLGYIPPEYSQTLTATFRGDVYSFGIVLLEILTGRRPVEVCKGINCRNLVSWVFLMKSERREDEIFDSSIWNKDCESQLREMLGIACKCVDQDPRRRPSIDQVVMWLDVVGIEGSK